MYKKLISAMLFVVLMAASAMAQNPNIPIPGKPSKTTNTRPAKPTNNRPAKPTPTHRAMPTDSVTTITVGNVSFEMVRVEAGSFVMGYIDEQGNDCDSDEKPYHRVIISKDYYIGKFEVTQELYEAVMGYNPSYRKTFDRPVESVSWEDAQKFCAKLSQLTGYNFSLPTEAEWEYAARGGHKATATEYSGSSNIDKVAWYKGNSGDQTHPVGQLSPNELGIYDMSGNVLEWCQDWYGEYGSATQTDPKGPSTGSARVQRGGEGSWYGYAGLCCVAYRCGGHPVSRYKFNGFRVVLH